MRVFVALDLPDAVRGQLIKLECGIPGVRWIDEEQLHLTLWFIGEVESKVYEELAERLDELRLPGFSLRLNEIGFFKRGKVPTALFAGLEKCDELIKLRNQVERCVVASGLEPEKRRFAPHITIARLKSAPDNRIGKFLSEHSQFKSESFSIDTFHIYSSQLTKYGAIYTKEASFPLATTEREHLQRIMALDDDY